MEPAGTGRDLELDPGRGALTHSAALPRFPKHIAFPQQHGAWALWLGPFAVGIGAAGSIRPGLLWLTLCVLGIFLAIQPLTVATKVLAGRKNRANLRPALNWLAVYGLFCLAGAAGLALLGHGRTLWLGAVALPVLAWQLRLVAQKAERGHVEAEIAGAWMLALAAPAAYWVGGGDLRTGILLWLLCALQAGAAIVSVYNRLNYRRMAEIPIWDERIRLSFRSNLFHAVNLGIALGLAATGWISWIAAVAFVLVLAEAVHGGLLRPPVGVRPAAIGIRQTIVTAGFSALLIAAQASGT
jgi:hypothetical protein